MDAEGELTACRGRLLRPARNPARVLGSRLRVRAAGARRRLSRRGWGQLIVFVLVGLSVLVASWQFSEAGGKWQDAVRQEVRQAAALQEASRRVYGEEAPLAFRLVSAEELETGLSGLRPESRIGASEQVIADRLVAQLRVQVVPGSVADRMGESGAELGDQLIERLADSLSESGFLDPDVTQATANRFAAGGTFAALAGILVVLVGVLVASTSRVFGARRSARGRVPPGNQELDLIPQPASVDSGEWKSTALKLAAWALLATLPFVQLVVAGQEQRAQAEAAREAVRLSSAVFVSNQVAAFIADSRQAVLAAETRALAREYVAFAATEPADQADEQAVAAAEYSAAARMGQMVDGVRTPSGADGVPAFAVAALKSRPSEWGRSEELRNLRIDLAEQASARGILVISSAAIAALAAALAAAAGVGHPSRERTRTRVTVGLLVLATIVATSGLFV